MDARAIATEGYWVEFERDTHITQPIVDSLTRNGTTGSCNVTVTDPSYITKARVQDVFGNEGEVGSIIGSGVMSLDFTAFTKTFPIGGILFSLANPAPKITFVSEDGAGNYSEPLVKKLCEGLVLGASIPVISEYTRGKTTASFQAANVIPGRTLVIWKNESSSALVAQIMVPGLNIITGLVPDFPYSFLAAYNKTDGELGLQVTEFGDQAAPSTWFFDEIDQKIQAMLISDAELQGYLGGTGSDPRVYFEWPPENTTCDADKPAYVVYFRSGGKVVPSTLAGMTKELMEELKIARDVRDLVNEGKLRMDSYPPEEKEK